METVNSVSFKTWIAEALSVEMQLALPPGGMDVLCVCLQRKLPEHLVRHRSEMTRQRIFKELDELFWRGRMKILREAASARMRGAVLLELLKQHRRGDGPLPPLWVVEDKLREMHGLTSAPKNEQATLPGILRIPFAEAPRRSLPETSDAHPFHALSESSKERLKIAVVAGPQLGVPYDPDIGRNLTRSGFSAARKMGCDALVLGGGLFRIIFQKTAGPNRLIADVLSGTQIDLDSIAANYRDEWRRITESGSLEPLFVTAAERFTDLLRGWFKVTRRPGNVPEFNHPVYVILSPDDIGLVRSMAYFELLYKKFERYQEASGAARIKAHFAAEAHKNWVEAHHGGEGEDEARAAYERAKVEAEEAAARATRFRATNFDSAQNVKVYERALGYLIQKIEEAIPNAVVVGQHSAYITFGTSGQLLKFVSDGSKAHMHELKNFGHLQRTGRLPDLTVSMHSGAHYMRKTSRENYRTPGALLGTVGFVEAPILVDREPILEALAGHPSRLPVARAVSDPMFEGGMLVITLDSRFMPNADVLPAEAVRRLGAQHANRAPAKRVWLMVSTDMHFGGANRLYLRRNTGLPVGLTEAALELMVRSGMSGSGAAPVVGFIAADDLTQGNHFETHTRPHHHQRSNAAVLSEIEERMQAVSLVENPELRSGKLAELIRDLSYQIVVRTPHNLGSQLIELRDGLLMPYRNVFKGILMQAKRSGVVVRGIGELTGRSDMRDVGIINFGSGNHATKTVKGQLYEGPVVADHLRAALRHDPDMRGYDVDRLICAPLFQDQAIGYGMLSIGGFTWGLHIAGTPPKRDSWYDLLHGWVQVNRQRGNPSTILRSMPIVHVTGDKHFFGFCYAGGDVYVMGPSSTHTDAFADIAGGLPENNAGLAFIGLPVKGPDYGEIATVHLTPAVVQDYLLSGRPFPWEDFLPNRA